MTARTFTAARRAELARLSRLQHAHAYGTEIQDGLREALVEIERLQDSWDSMKHYLDNRSECGIERAEMARLEQERTA